MNAVSETTTGATPIAGPSQWIMGSTVDGHDFMVRVPPVKADGAAQRIEIASQDQGITLDLDAEQLDGFARLIMTAVTSGSTHVVYPARFRVGEDGKHEFAPVGAEGDFDSSDLAMEALDYSSQQLYLAAKRFTRAFERHELDMGLTDDLVTIGSAAGLLTEAADEYGCAYELLESTGLFEPSIEQLAEEVLAEGQANRDRQVAWLAEEG